MPVDVPWSRLIRFVGEDEQIYFGDAIVPDADFDVGAAINLPSLKAKMITGNPLSTDCIVTDKVMKVQKLLGPLTSSMVPAVRCIGGNYAAHCMKSLMNTLQPGADIPTVKEIGMEPKPNPDMFPKAPCSISGHGDDVEIPKIAQDDQADYEGELTIVIGKDAKNISEEDALDYVLGYTVADDVSARSGNFKPVLRSLC